LHNVVGAFFWSASNLAANGMQLSASPDESRPTYIALFSCITALVGVALGTLCGGWFLEWCNAARLFTGSFDRYKVLILASVVLRFGFTLLLVPPMSNENEATLKDALRGMLHG
jgi:MFS family permease